MHQSRQNLPVLRWTTSTGKPKQEGCQVAGCQQSKISTHCRYCVWIATGSRVHVNEPRFMDRVTANFACHSFRPNFGNGSITSLQRSIGTHFANHIKNAVRDLNCFALTTSRPHQSTQSPFLQSLDHNSDFYTGALIDAVPSCNVITTRLVL